MIHKLIPVLVLCTLLVGCASSGMKDVRKSGFIDNYAMLKPGGSDRAALVYINPDVDFKPYNQIMFERVTIMLSDEADYKGIDPALFKELTDYYENALIDAVRSGYQVVDQPGPGVLRVRIAITDIKPSKPVSNTMSSIIPVGMVVAGVTKAASGDNLGTGEASTEIEVLDSLSGQQLAAAVDRRQGGKSMFRGKWTDTKQAFDHWAKRFRQRLDEARNVR